MMAKNADKRLKQQKRGAFRVNDETESKAAKTALKADYFGCVVKRIQKNT